ncbi:MAG: glycosyltransferase family 4 protein [Phycisphaeraceae bacterium]|nr:glycosyltransferase family 4 protein [Phycisphaeraceae bacterium]
MGEGAMDNVNRPLVALINNVQTPYRIHLHRRIVREIPEIRIASVYTHDQPDQPWESRRIDEINPILFGQGHPVVEQARLKWVRSDWRKGGRITAWLRDQNASAVILGGYNDLTRLRIIRWCRRAGVPCFIFADSNIKGDTATGLRRLIKRMFVGWVVRNVTGLMPCGTLGRAFFERYGADPKRCYFVPYEPDYDLIRGIDEQSVSEARRAFGLRPDRRHLVVCARLVQFKRVDLAIDAFAAIAGERPEWDLVIIGDGPLRAELQARVPATLRERVKWAGFVGEQARVSALYRASDVLLCPSDYEPWAVVINEAVGAGMAVVASDVVGAAAELVRDGVNGAIFHAGDLGGLIGKLREVTAPTNIDQFKGGSEGVLAAWRSRGDPIKGTRAALADAGVIPSDNSVANGPGSYDRR